MVGPARPEAWRNAMFLLPLDVRLDELVALRVFYRLHGRRDLLRGEDEPACVCMSDPRRWRQRLRNVEGRGRRGVLMRAVRSHREHPSARIQVVRSVSRSYLNVCASPWSPELRSACSIRRG